MVSEILQFAGFLLIIGVAFVLWMFIVYLPGRTLENGWKDQRVERQSADGYDRREVTSGDSARETG